MNYLSPIFVSIGANLSTLDGRVARASCAMAAEALRALPGVRLVAVSRWYATDPIPAGGPRYINGVAWLQGDVDPAWLLARLLAIEARAGRQRSTANAPRVLDLDLIAMGSLQRLSPDPVLPHPRAHLRRFVLQPLAELMPDWVHPRFGQTASALLAALPDQGVELL